MKHFINGGWRWRNNSSSKFITFLLSIDNNIIFWNTMKHENVVMLITSLLIIVKKLFLKVLKKLLESSIRRSTNQFVSICIQFGKYLIRML